MPPHPHLPLTRGPPASCPADLCASTVDVVEPAQVEAVPRHEAAGRRILTVPPEQSRQKLSPAAPARLSNVADLPGRHSPKETPAVLLLTPTRASDARSRSRSPSRRRARAGHRARTVRVHRPEPRLSPPPEPPWRAERGPQSRCAEVERGAAPLVDAAPCRAAGRRATRLAAGGRRASPARGPPAARAEGFRARRGERERGRRCRWKPSASRPSFLPRRAAVAAAAAAMKSGVASAASAAATTADATATTARGRSVRRQPPTKWRLASTRMSPGSAERRALASRSAGSGVSAAPTAAEGLAPPRASTCRRAPRPRRHRRRRRRAARPPARRAARRRGATATPLAERARGRRARRSPAGGGGGRRRDRLRRRRRRALEAQRRHRCWSPPPSPTAARRPCRRRPWPRRRTSTDSGGRAPSDGDSCAPTVNALCCPTTAPPPTPTSCTAAAAAERCRARSAGALARRPYGEWTPPSRARGVPSLSSRSPLELPPGAFPRQAVLLDFLLAPNVVVVGARRSSMPINAVRARGVRSDGCSRRPAACRGEEMGDAHRSPPPCPSGCAKDRPTVKPVLSESCVSAITEDWRPTLPDVFSSRRGKEAPAAGTFFKQPGKAAASNQFKVGGSVGMLPRRRDAQGHSRPRPLAALEKETFGTSRRFVPRRRGRPLIWP